MCYFILKKQYTKRCGAFPEGALESPIPANFSLNPIRGSFYRLAELEAATSDGLFNGGLRDRSGVGLCGLLFHKTYRAGIPVMTRKFNRCA